MTPSSSVVLNLRQLSRARLLEPEALQGTGGKLFDPPENEVIHLLQSHELGADFRVEVILGLREVISTLLSSLVHPDFASQTGSWGPALIRLGRVLDVARPPELEFYAEALFWIALGTND